MYYIFNLVAFPYIQGVVLSNNNLFDLTIYPIILIVSIMSEQLIRQEKCRKMKLSSVALREPYQAEV